MTVGIIAVVYFFGFFFFTTHYYPGTTVGSMKIGWRSEASARQYLKDKLSEITVTVEEPEGEELITAVDAGLAYTDLKVLGQILNRQKGQI